MWLIIIFLKVWYVLTLFLVLFYKPTFSGKISPFHSLSLLSLSDDFVPASTWSPVFYWVRAGPILERTMFYLWALWSVRGLVQVMAVPWALLYPIPPSTGCVFSLHPGAGNMLIPLLLSIALVSVPWLLWEIFCPYFLLHCAPTSCCLFFTQAAALWFHTMLHNLTCLKIWLYVSVFMHDVWSGNEHMGNIGPCTKGCICGGQRKTFSSRFPFTFMWISGMEFRSHRLALSNVFIHWAVLPESIFWVFF